MRGEMKFMKKSQTWKGSGVEFNPSSFAGTSYDWWHFVALVNGKVIFNAYSYSQTTCKHQGKMRTLLSSLNITIDLVVKTRKSLSNSDALQDSILNDKMEIREIETSLANPRRKKALDESRNASIADFLEHIKLTEIVMIGSKLQVVMK